MTSKLFSGTVLRTSNSTSDVTKPLSNWWKSLNQGYYQGYFYSADPGTRPHMWSGVRTLSTTGTYSINLEDDDWLTTSGTAVSGDKVILVFWEAYSDRESKNVLNRYLLRGWFETTISGPEEYIDYPLIAKTNIISNFITDLNTRIYKTDTEYNFYYGATWEAEYGYTGEQHYRKTSGGYAFTGGSSITMSQASTVYGEQIFYDIDDIKQEIQFTREPAAASTLTLTPETLEEDNFVYTFTDYTDSKLEITTYLKIDGVYSLVDEDYLKYFPVDIPIKEPSVLNLDLFRDRSFYMVLNTDIDSVAGFQAQIRETPDSDTILANITISTEFVLGLAVITMSLTATQVESIFDQLDLNFGSATTTKTLSWELMMTNTSLLDIEKHSFIHGSCYLHGTVTRN